MNSDEILEAWYEYTRERDEAHVPVSCFYGGYRAAMRKAEADVLMLTKERDRLREVNGDLLEACERLLRADERPPSEEQATEAVEAMTQVRAAIKKARGE